MDQKKYNIIEGLATYGGECGNFAQVQGEADGWIVYRFKANHFMWQPTDDLVCCGTVEQVRDVVNSWILTSPKYCQVCQSDNHSNMHE